MVLCPKERAGLSHALLAPFALSALGAVGKRAERAVKAGFFG